jgi:hypothetical protein
MTSVLTARAGDWMPLLPDQDFYDFQLFAPPDLQDYEIYPEPSEGIFFNYDRLYWGITPPRVTRGCRDTDRRLSDPTDPISPQAIVQLNNGGIQAGAAATSAHRNVIGGIFIYGADPLRARPQYELDADGHVLGQSLRGRLDLRRPGPAGRLLQYRRPEPELPDKQRIRRVVTDPDLHPDDDGRRWRYGHWGRDPVSRSRPRRSRRTARRRIT